MMLIELNEDTIKVKKGDNIIVISNRHMIYVRDIVTQFDYYFGSVEPMYQGGYNVVDFSEPNYHRVKGLDLFPILFPSFSEPLESTNQYLEFAQLKEGDTVLDLGAYSGLTSILFSQKVGKSGLVVAVEADIENIKCAIQNTKRYISQTGNYINLIYSAMWSHSKGIYFSNECNMGSSATDIVGNRGNVDFVPSWTLSDLVGALDRVDFIKVDIEGAEVEIFKDAAFFEKYNPRMIVETHGKGSEAIVCATLESYGYTVKEIVQNGVRFPLLECTR